MAAYKNTDDILFHIRNRFCVGCNDRNGILCRSCRVADCMDEIDDAPTTFDAMLVVHGHWIPVMIDDKIFDGVNIENIKTLKGRVNRCSVCGEDIITNGIDETGTGCIAKANNPYCRWCGARMDEESGEKNVPG